MTDDSVSGFFGRQFDGRRYLRVPELIELGLAGNRRTIFNMVRRGDLPAPIRIGRCLLFPTAALAKRLTTMEREAAERTAPADAEDDQESMTQ
jgi:predicted DNA-binding transcriptional regulator AlpA